MKVEEASPTVAKQFPAVYRRLCCPFAPTEHRPTAESLAILQHVTDAGPPTVTEAAQHTRRSQAAMSELLQRLVKRGLPARIQDEHDPRRTLVWLTPRGQETLDEAKRLLSEQSLAAAMRQMSPRHRRALIRSTQILLDTKPK
jgi:DNA-binding MarR family transcriptional regulator